MAPETNEVASQTDEQSQAAKKDYKHAKKGRQGREHQGCCSWKRMGILVALAAVLIGFFKKVKVRLMLPVTLTVFRLTLHVVVQQDYIAEELLPGLDPYLDPVRQVLPDSISEHVRLVRNSSDEEARPGLELYAQGRRPKHPVVVVPGFVTSGLELWQGQDCAKQYFRWNTTAELPGGLILRRHPWLSSSVCVQAADLGLAGHDAVFL